MPVDLSSLERVPGQIYGSRSVSLSGFYGFEKAFPPRKLIDFGDAARRVMNCIEQPSALQLILCRMVSPVFVNKYLTALVTDQEALVVRLRLSLRP